MYYDLKESGKRIAVLRKGQGCTQERAADDMGINIKTYRAIEQGSRGGSIDTLCLIADYYGVTLDYLVTGKCTTDELAQITCNLTKEQLSQIVSIIRNMISTLGW